MKQTLAVIVILLCLAAPAFGAGPARIVSLAPNITEILYDLGLEDDPDRRRQPEGDL
jgi:ABC-type hemin transport system substrate-binding protein